MGTQHAADVPTAFPRWILWTFVVMPPCALGVAAFSTKAPDAGGERAASVVTPVTEPPEAPAAEPVATVTVPPQLLSRLHLLRSTWDARQRADILSAAAGEAKELAVDLERILRARQHPLLAEAVEYAGATKAVSLRPAIVELVAAGDVSPDVRFQAVHAAEQLKPWAQDRLAGLLGAPFRRVRLAALEITKGRADIPWSLVVPLLTAVDDGAPDEAVRAAAVAAIPERPPEPMLVQELFNLMEFGDTADQVVAMRALGRTDFGPRVASRLCEALEVLDDEGKRECLRVLGSRGRAVPSPDSIWRVATDEQAEPEVRADAFYCLERTRSLPAVDLRSREPGGEPLTEYFVARYLVAAGDVQGVDRLMKLVQSDSERVSRASRQLLSWLTGCGPGASVEEFASRRPRFEAALGQRALPAPLR